MTRLAVLADIHGNLPALEAVRADMEAFNVDHVVVAGDVVNWGPFSAAVMAIVTGEGWAVIRGNNEFYLLDYNTPRQPPHWKDYTLLPWLYEQLEGRWHHVIAGWADELTLLYPDAPAARVVHGRPGSAWHGLSPMTTEGEIAAVLEGTKEGTIISGHTHLAMDRWVERWHILNPGSVGVPLDGMGGASYMILDGDADGWTPIFRRVLYDPALLYREFERQRFVERFGVAARLVVREFETCRLHIHPFNLWRAAHHPDQPLSDRLLTLFEAVDTWQYIPAEYHLNRYSVSGVCAPKSYLLKAFESSYPCDPKPVLRRRYREARCDSGDSITMPYEICWYIPKRIMLITMRGHMTLDEFAAMTRESIDYTHQGISPVHAIVDQRHLESVPMHLNTLKNVGVAKQPNSGFTVMVSDNRASRFISNAIFHTIGLEMRSCSTFEEALDILKRVDVSLPIT